MRPGHKGKRLYHSHLSDQYRSFVIGERNG